MGVRWYRNPGWRSHMGKDVELGHNNRLQRSVRYAARR